MFLSYCMFVFDIIFVIKKTLVLLRKFALFSLINMQYEHFSRQLRKKYSTRLHVLDQLVDQLKQKNQSSKIDLNENRKVSEPYFNECILTAERMKNNRRSERDRKICYENLILAEKLERIKKQSGQNRKISKANCKHETSR